MCVAALRLRQGGGRWETGDEYGQTRYGNNNWYGHDNKMTRYDWNALEKQRDDFFRFYRCCRPAPPLPHSPLCSSSTRHFLRLACGASAVWLQCRKDQSRGAVEKVAGGLEGFFFFFFLPTHM